MIPAMISSLVILFLYWQRARDKAGASASTGAEGLRREIAELNARLDALQTRLTPSPPR